MKRWILTLLIINLVIQFNTKSSGSTNENILKIRSIADITTLDPAFIVSTPESIILDAIHRKLITYMPGNYWVWEMDAAKSISQIDDTHIEFSLKQGIFFTNGFGEMTAEDVKYSFERFIDPSLKSDLAGGWGALDHVFITGKYSGIIVLKTPFMPLWSSTLPGVTGHILSKKASTSINKNRLHLQQAYSGPYYLKEWKPKERIILVRNENYIGFNGLKADFDQIHVFPISDDRTAEMAFETGDLDFTCVSLASYVRYLQKLPKNSTIGYFPSLYSYHLGQNQNNDLLKDIRVRQAIQIAVNIPEIIQESYLGLALPATGIVPYGIIGYRPTSHIPLIGDTKKAKELLRSAGFPNGISVTLDCQNKTVDIKTAQIIQKTLIQAGIKVKINLYDVETFRQLGKKSSGNNRNQLQLFLSRWSADPDPNYTLQYFSSMYIGSNNWEHFANKAYDQMVIQGVKELDSIKRSKLYIKMQDMLEDSGSFRFITNETTPLVYRNKIIPGLRPDGIPLLHYFKKNRE